MRRVVVAVLAASLIGAMVASPILAETGQRDRFNYDRVQGNFAFSEGGRTYEGQFLIDRDNETGGAIALFFYSWRVYEQLCDNGSPEDPIDDFVGEELIDFTSYETAPTTLSIEASLSEASASATSAGVYTVVADPCAGTSVESPQTVSWQVAVEATGPVVMTTQVDRYPNEDGTVTTLSVKSSQRTAAGSIVINGGAALVLTDASIANIRVVQRTH